MTESHSENLQLEITSGGNETVVTVAGEIDVHTAQQLDQSMRKLALAETSSVVLDMAGVGFIDSSGLRSLLTAQRQFERAGVVFSLCRLSPAMRRLLEVTGLLATFSVSD